MPEIGGVWYGDTAYEHMRQIAEQTSIEPSPRHGKTELLNEAEVIHAFHQEFPGVVMTDGEENE